jgi:predicted nucleic-acid-binding protein
VRITADTNVLVRALMGDDPHQAALAEAVLAQAELVAVPLPVLCELVWVLARGYRVPADEIAVALHGLMAAGNVAANRPAVAAGLAMMAAGGDFADGVIAFEGQWLGAEAFVSFDRRAVALAERQGMRARLLG